MNLAPQLAFRGECQQAFECYAKLFDGEIVVMNTFGGNKEHQLPPGSVPGPADQVRFAEIRFGNSVLRGNDVTDDAFVPMQGFSVSVHVKSVERARRIFDGLADNGNVTAALSEVDWTGQSCSAWSRIASACRGLSSH